MSNYKSIVDRIYTKTPCDADWDSMVGNNQVRFCQHCNLTVYNISTMTRRRAEELVAKSNGRLCLGYYRSGDGRIVTADNPSKSHQLTRRATRLAAGAFTVALSMSSLVTGQTTKAPTEISAQDKSKDSSKKSDTDKKIAESSGSNKISGTIKDQKEAMIAGAKVHLNGPNESEEYDTTTNNEGYFVFENFSAGKYKLTIKATNFITTEVNEIDVLSGTDASVTLSLQVSSESLTVGAVGVARPSDLLVLAAMEDDLEGLKVLVDVGLDVNKVDETTHATALYYAVENDNIEMAKLLIALGAKPDPPVSTDMDEEGNPIIGSPALTGISEKTSLEMIDLIINAGGRLNLVDQWGRSPLMDATMLEDPGVLHKLIRIGANVNDVSINGYTPLIAAVVTGKYENAKVLIAAGAKVNHQDNDGKTALMQINDETKLELVKLLLDSKADLKLRDNYGNTALLNASNQDVKVVEALINAGAKVDDADNDGTTSLMAAARNGNLDNVKALIAAKADINLRDKQGRTALQQAIENNKDNSNLEVIKLLRSHGARE